MVTKAWSGVLLGLLVQPVSAANWTLTPALQDRKSVV
jgi:hypothetical protein